MKLGVSTYSFYNAIQSGEMTVLDVFDWVADHGGEHVEIVPMGFSLQKNPELVHQIREKSTLLGIDISNYAVSANFTDLTTAEFMAEVNKLKQEVDIAYTLGVQRMRHDIAWRLASDSDTDRFLDELPKLVTACQIIADYASQYGIVTSIENHGYYVQSADRVLQLISTVNRSNFKLTLDVANFLCVDADPYTAVKRLLPFASMIHLKDFHVRADFPGEGWFSTVAGGYLGGAIFGNGDVDVRSILALIKNSNYDGYLSIEFEGEEECTTGTRLSLENARQIWESTTVDS